MLFERDQAMAVLLAHLSEPPPLSPRPPQPIADTLTRTMRRPILIVLAAAVISVAGAVAFVLANFLGTAGYQRTGPLAVLPAGETGIVASLAFNPSGDTLAIATSRTCLWSLAASHCTATVPSACGRVQPRRQDHRHRRPERHRLPLAPELTTRSPGISPRPRAR